MVSGRPIGVTLTERDNGVAARFIARGGGGPGEPLPHPSAINVAPTTLTWRQGEPLHLVDPICLNVRAGLAHTLHPLLWMKLHNHLKGNWLPATHPNRH